MERHIPTLQRLPGVTEDGMTYSNITKVTRGYRRWNDIFQHYKGYPGLQKIEWHIPTLQRLPGATEDGIFQHYKES